MLCKLLLVLLLTTVIWILLPSLRVRDKPCSVLSFIFITFISSSTCFFCKYHYFSFQILYCFCLILTEFESWMLVDLMKIGAWVTKLTPAKAGKELTHPGVPSQAVRQVACQVLAYVHDVVFSAMILIFAKAWLVKLTDGLSFRCCHFHEANIKNSKTTLVGIEKLFWSSHRGL